MLRPVEGLAFPSRVGIVSPQGRYSELVSVYLVGFSLWLHAGFPHRLGIPGALCGRYSTFLWGTNFEQGLGIAVDGEGKAYVTGSTSSTDFPIILGAYEGVSAGVTPALVKCPPSGLFTLRGSISPNPSWTAL